MVVEIKTFDWQYIEYMAGITAQLNGFGIASWERQEFN
jgi:hypothetical protein